MIGAEWAGPETPGDQRGSLSTERDDMIRTMGTLSASLLEKLLPSAQAQACTSYYCETSTTSAHYRCCRICSGGVKSCTGWYVSHYCTRCRT
jgi:hypothetical protein